MRSSRRAAILVVVVFFFFTTMMPTLPTFELKHIAIGVIAFMLVFPAHFANIVRAVCASDTTIEIVFLTIHFPFYVFMYVYALYMNTMLPVVENVVHFLMNGFIGYRGIAYVLYGMVSGIVDRVLEFYEPLFSLVSSDSSSSFHVPDGVVVPFLVVMMMAASVFIIMMVSSELPT